MAPHHTLKPDRTALYAATRRWRARSPCEDTSYRSVASGIRCLWGKMSLGWMGVTFDGRNPTNQWNMVGRYILCENIPSSLTQLVSRISSIDCIAVTKRTSGWEGWGKVRLVLPRRTGFIQNACGNRVLWLEHPVYVLYLHMVCDFSPSLAMGMSTQIVGS